MMEGNVVIVLGVIYAGVMVVVWYLIMFFIFVVKNFEVYVKKFCIDFEIGKKNYVIV